MFNVSRKLKQKIALKRGYVSVKSDSRNGEEVKFHTLGTLEYTKITESDGEADFLNKFISVLENGYTVFDVGANMGMFSIYARAAGKDITIYSFEPVDEYYKRLLQNISLNKMKDIHAFNFGLGCENKNIKFMYKNVLGSGMGSGSEKYSRRYKLDFEEQTCEIKKGDNFIHKSATSVPNVIKIDVEGMEMDVLEGLVETLQHEECRYVFCEIHTALDPLLYGNVCQFLIDKGYETANIYAKKEGIGIIAFK